jgi:hypothetical protein
MDQERRRRERENEATAGCRSGLERVVDGHRTRDSGTGPALEVLFPRAQSRNSSRYLHVGDVFTIFVKKPLRRMAFSRSLPPLRKLTPISLLCGCIVAASLTAAQTRDLPVPQKPFVFKDSSGKQVSAPIVESSEMRKLPVPAAKPQAPGVNPILAKAATIAQERANAHSKRRCWQYVKEALLAAGAVDSYPGTALAKQAGTELVDNFGFQKLSVTDPYKAPVGSVLVYDAQGQAGHVEIRTKDGFVSDFKTPTPSKRKLIGVYTKA